jgi:hypothetical protein
MKPKYETAIADDHLQYIAGRRFVALWHMRQAQYEVTTHSDEVDWGFWFYWC